LLLIRGNLWAGPGTAKKGITRVATLRLDLPALQYPSARAPGRRADPPLCPGREPMKKEGEASCHPPALALALIDRAVHAARPLPGRADAACLHGRGLCGILWEEGSLMLAVMRKLIARA